MLRSAFSGWTRSRFPFARLEQLSAKDMKITIVLGAFLPVPPIMGGAVEKAWFGLAQEFATRGHDVVVISRAVAQLPPEELVDRVRHIRVRGFDTPRSLVWLK